MNSLWSAKLARELHSYRNSFDFRLRTEHFDDAFGRLNQIERCPVQSEYTILYKAKVQ